MEQLVRLLGQRAADFGRVDAAQDSLTLSVVRATLLHNIGDRRFGRRVLVVRVGAVQETVYVDTKNK